LSERLPRALRANAQLHHTQFSRIAGRLAPQLLRNQVERRRERYESLNRRLATSIVANAQAHRARIVRNRDRLTACSNAAQRAMLNLLDRHAARVERADKLLLAFSYREVLKRGFALVRDGEGHPLHAAANVTSGMHLSLEFSDGRVNAVAEGDAVPRPVPPPRRRLRPRGGDDGQGSLFG
jgi:exodeoxyribonuclease VII large subunit